MIAKVVRITHADPEIIEGIMGLHDKCFVRQLGWGSSFTQDVGDFLQDFAGCLKYERSGLWVAKIEKNIVGSIVIDERDYGPGSARLRLFIVDSACHHQGIGKSLMSRAIEFCSVSGYAKIMLRTFDVLSKARAMYLRYGFKILKERDVERWGRHLREQLFGLDLRQAGSSLNATDSSPSDWA